VLSAPEEMDAERNRFFRGARCRNVVPELSTLTVLAVTATNLMGCSPSFGRGLYRARP
jgi:hypothetical protein